VLCFFTLPPPGGVGKHQINIGSYSLVNDASVDRVVVMDQNWSLTSLIIHA